MFTQTKYPSILILLRDKASYIVHRTCHRETPRAYHGGLARTDGWPAQWRCPCLGPLLYLKDPCVPGPTVEMDPLSLMSP